MLGPRVAILSEKARMHKSLISGSFGKIPLALDGLWLPGEFLGSLGSVLELSWSVLEASWSILGFDVRQLGLSGATLEVIWDSLRPSWSHLGRNTTI
eukprot:88353-Pyramimonas_sp.AAC.1